MGDYRCPMQRCRYYRQLQYVPVLAVYWKKIHCQLYYCGLLIAFVIERVTETTNDEVNRIMGINFVGPLNLMRHVIPHFLAKPGTAQGEGFMTVLPDKGAIVNVCSIAAVRGAAAGALYTASKHALLGLSRNTAFMYAMDGVRTNVVMPGAVMTNIFANSGHTDASAPHIPIKDPIGAPIIELRQSILAFARPPTDVARAIVFLAGADAVNGAELTVDSGWNSS